MCESAPVNLCENNEEQKIKKLRPGMLAFSGRYFFDFSRRLSRLRWSEAESKWLVVSKKARHEQDTKCLRMASRDMDNCPEAFLV
jgi:hypothetical protein